MIDENHFRGEHPPAPGDGAWYRDSRARTRRRRRRRRRGRRAPNARAETAKRAAARPKPARSPDFRNVRRERIVPARGGAPKVRLEKSNALLSCPTGAETLLARTLADFVDVPIVVADATTLTQAGYVGEDVESLLYKLLQAADFDVDAAQRHRVYVDEIDKLAREIPKRQHHARRVRRGGAASGLKMVEGTVVNVPEKGGRKNPRGEFIQMDTTNILFVCGGAFAGLETVVARRLDRDRNRDRNRDRTYDGRRTEGSKFESSESSEGLRSGSASGFSSNAQSNEASDATRSSLASARRDARDARGFVDGVFRFVVRRGGGLRGGGDASSRRGRRPRRGGVSRLGRVRTHSRIRSVDFTSPVPLRSLGRTSSSAC